GYACVDRGGRRKGTRHVGDPPSLAEAGRGHGEGRGPAPPRRGGRAPRRRRRDRTARPGAAGGDPPRVPAVDEAAARGLRLVQRLRGRAASPAPPLLPSSPVCPRLS